jgi:hypothetical protein
MLQQHLDIIKSEIRAISSEFDEYSFSISSKIKDKFQCFGYLSASEYQLKKSQIKAILSKYLFVESVSENHDKDYVDFSFKCFTNFSEEESIILKLEERICQ